MKVRIRPSAQDDLSDGFAFYESQQAGLGSYFLDSLFADIDSLALHGGVHRRLHGAHRLLARTFPFAVYYDVVGDTAHVKAVLDCRRDPKWIRKHLSEDR
ncbi:MAG: type II toxin-antitoxin system RelE/ParE family toxin [Opitutaceae bacterium]